MWWETVLGYKLYRREYSMFVIVTPVLQNLWRYAGTDGLPRAACAPIETCAKPMGSNPPQYVDHR